jgi:hypothetical protein
MKPKNHPGKVRRRRERAKERAEGRPSAPGEGYGNAADYGPDTRYRVGAKHRDAGGEIASVPEGFPKTHYSYRSSTLTHPHIRRS